MVCLDCGTLNSGRRTVPGSFLAEIGVWLVCVFFGASTGMWFVLLLPLGYTLYRMVWRKRACTACGSGRLAPEHSPAGRHMIETLRKTPPS